MEEYKRVKAKIFQNFKRRDLAIVNLDDENSLDLPFPKRKRFFSKKNLNKGCYLKNGYVFCDKKKIMLQTEIPLLGEKNIENVLCCVAIARAFKIKPYTIRKAISIFKAPSHRLEFLGEYNGVKIYNDSKSTNVACVQMAIDSVGDNNLILMVGGRNKDNDFELFFTKNFTAKKIITFGESALILEKLAKKYNYEVISFEKMEDATRYAKSIAVENDTILFSPGCASFDEFASYSARGQRFKEIVTEQP
jgi:UDP-N-acetylmuramoylalanine--D-glutamate ligase